MIDMRRGDDPPEVVLLSIDDTLRERGIEEGAFSVVKTVQGGEAVFQPMATSEVAGFKARKKAEG